MLSLAKPLFLDIYDLKFFLVYSIAGIRSSFLKFNNVADYMTFFCCCLELVLLCCAFGSSSSESIPEFFKKERCLSIIVDSYCSDILSFYLSWWFLCSWIWSFLLSLSSNLSLCFYKHLLFFLIHYLNLDAFLIFSKPKCLIFLDLPKTLEHDYLILSILPIFSCLSVLMCSIISWMKIQYLLRY